MHRLGIVPGIVGSHGAVVDERTDAGERTARSPAAPNLGRQVGRAVPAPPQPQQPVSAHDISDQLFTPGQGEQLAVSDDSLVGVEDVVEGGEPAHAESVAGLGRVRGCVRKAGDGGS